MHIIVQRFRELAQICFEAELGWCSHEKGDLDDAVKKFESVLTKMEQFSDQEYPLFYIFRMRFGSSLAWLSHTWQMNGTVMQLNTSISKPFVGCFANFEAPPEDTKDHAVQAYRLLWAHLAKYAASFAEMDFIDSIAKRSMARTDGKQIFLALTETYKAIYLNSLVNLDFSKALQAGIEYAKLFAMLSDYKSSMDGRWNLNELVDVESDSQDLSMGLYDMWSDGLSALILEPMTMFICSLDKEPSLDFPKWLDLMIDTFGEEHKLIEIVKWMEKIVSAIFNGGEEIEMIRRDAWDVSADLQQTRRLSIIAMSVLPNVQLSDTLSAQFSMLKNMTQPLMEDSHWGLFFFRIVVKRWTYFANNQKFLMLSPSAWSTMILDAVSAASSTASDVAKLLLLVGEATATKWPKEILSELREISN